MVNTSCVVVEGDEGCDKFLVSYIVPEGKTSQKEVRSALKKRLPLYMIPSRFVFMERQVTQLCILHLFCNIFCLINAFITEAGVITKVKISLCTQ